jgi:hypothetical protein
MRNLSNAAHPPWCLSGPDCSTSPGWRESGLVQADPSGQALIQVGAGLWRMDLEPEFTRPPEPVGGIRLEFTLGEDVERWPINLVQSRALVPVLQSLLGRADAALTRAA